MATLDPDSTLALLQSPLPSVHGEEGQNRRQEEASEDEEEVFFGPVTDKERNGKYSV